MRPNDWSVPSKSNRTNPRSSFPQLHSRLLLENVFLYTSIVQKSIHKTVLCQLRYLLQGENFLKKSLPLLSNNSCFIFCVHQKDKRQWGPQLPWKASVFAVQLSEKKKLLQGELHSPDESSKISFKTLCFYFTKVIFFLVWFNLTSSSEKLFCSTLIW